MEHKNKSLGVGSSNTITYNIRPTDDFLILTEKISTTDLHKNSRF